MLHKKILLAVASLFIRLFVLRCCYKRHHFLIMSKTLFALVAFLAIAAVVIADTCGGNCPSNDCPGCPCGTASNYVDIGSWCNSFSGWDQACCNCIVSHESSGNANAANYNSWDSSYDIGVWQVNTVNWNDCSGGAAPCNPSTNLQCAIDVWRWGGNTFRLWSTCGGCGCC